MELLLSTHYNSVALAKIDRIGPLKEHNGQKVDYTYADCAPRTQWGDGTQYVIRLPFNEFLKAYQAFERSGDLKDFRDENIKNIQQAVLKP